MRHRLSWNGGCGRGRVFGGPHRISTVSVTQLLAMRGQPDGNILRGTAPSFPSLPPQTHCHKFPVPVHCWVLACHQSFLPPLRSKCAAPSLVFSGTSPARGLWRMVSVPVWGVGLGDVGLLLARVDEGYILDPGRFPTTAAHLRPCYGRVTTVGSGVLRTSCIVYLI